MPEHSYIPEKYHILSGSALKVLAVVCMIIDHVGAMILGETDQVLLQIAGHTLTVYELMRLIGRIAFPLFAFLLVEGFVHTRNRKKYGVRLFLFACISEIPWDLAVFGEVGFRMQNVFFTLLLGYLAMSVMEALERESGRKRQIRYVAALFVLMGITLVVRSDYGLSGLGFILMMYLLRQQPLYRAILSCCILSSRWKAGLSAIPISLYNGKRGFIQGKTAQILFYAIYPVHLLLLYGLQRLITGP